MDENLTFRVMEIMDNPDHHTTFFKLRMLRKMNQFLLEPIGFGKIGLKELLRPEANVTTEILSLF